MNISLRQLKLFESVSRHLSFTRAAEELHLTQPAVSIQIGQLEETVGLPLFEQIGKRIFLTEAGLLMQTLSTGMIEDLARFEMEIADRKGLKKGQLRIGVTTTAKYFIPDILGQFCETYPGIEVALKVSNQLNLLERLGRNEDDLYILGQPPKKMTVHATPFRDNPLVVVAHPDHVLVGLSGPIPPQRLAEEWFLMRETGSGTREATEKFFRDRGIPIKERLNLGSNEAIKQAVMAKLGIAVLSRSTSLLEIELGRIAVLDIEGFPILRHWHIVYPLEKKLTVVADAFLQSLMSQADTSHHTHLNNDQSTSEAPE